MASVTRWEPTSSGAEARQKGRLIAALKRCATQSPVFLVPVSPAIHKYDALWHTAFMHRLTLGDFELTVFSDGTYPLDGGAFFGVVPKVMWSRKVAADERN